MMKVWHRNNLVRIASVLLIMGLSMALVACEQAAEEPSEQIVPEILDSDEPASEAQPLPNQEEAGVQENEFEPAGEAQVDTVEVQFQGSALEQVQVVVSGNLNDSCTEITNREVERVEDTFQVTLTTQRLAGQMCTEALVPYQEVIRLDVTGLPAGEYLVQVNDKSETFNLGEASQELPFESPEEAEAYYIDQAKAALAQQQSVDPAEIQVESVEQLDEVEGVYSVKLRLDDQVYEYHGRAGQALAVSDALPPGPLQPEMEVGGYNELVETLQAMDDTEVIPVDEAQHEPPHPLFSVPAQLVNMNAEEVWVYEYQDAAAAEAEAALISPDGLQIQSSQETGPATIDWEETPHFYQKGPLIVLYTGDEVRTLQALQIVLGPQFAGGEVPLEGVTEESDG